MLTGTAFPISTKKKIDSITLSRLYLSNNQIKDISALVKNANAGGFKTPTLYNVFEIWLLDNPLDSNSKNNLIPQLRNMDILVNGY